MPTPVGIARQCLTQEASSVLDDAVTVARRRSHSQTTSLHVISAFLSLPSSSLRDACSRVSNSSYSPKFQFKALELSFTSALDRLPSTHSADSSEPPISNSLMAAIKRSQANQRRNPESFHLYQQQQQSSSSSSSSTSSVNCVKVELQQLILSILDDPIVSRVFGEVGFRSCDIKLAILRPLRPLGTPFHRSGSFSLSSPRRPPLFLCNLEPDKNFSFPFLGGCSQLSDGDGDFKRIGEVLARKKERNPLLVGVCASEVLTRFSEFVGRGSEGVLPADVAGLSFFCIKKEIPKFISEGVVLGSKLKELDQLIGSCCGPGVVVSFGDLKVLLDDGSGDAVSSVVSQLSKLLELYSGKVWLMGTVASYEMYLKFVMKFPSIEKDWDLQLLSITSLKSPIGGLPSRTQSLMESFVPFGGFFATTFDHRPLLTNTRQPLSRCHLCNEKYEQEVSAFLNGGCTPSVADQVNASLPTWLQKAEVNANKGVKRLDLTKAKDDGTILNAKVTGLQHKWNDICQRLHHCSQISSTDKYRIGPLVLPGVIGNSFVSDKEDDTNNLSSGTATNARSDRSDYENAQPSMSIGLHSVSSPTQKIPKPVISEDKVENHACTQEVRASITDCHQTESLPFPSCLLSSSSLPGNYTSSSSTISVTTDLGLGIIGSPSYKEPKKLTFQNHKDWHHESLDCSPTVVDVERPNISNPSVHSPSCSGPDSMEQIDPSEFKSLWRFLRDKIGRQEEALRDISHTIVRCRTGSVRRHGANLKRDVWLNFIGLDRVAKRRTALALAEIVFGSNQNITRVDLNSQDGITRPNTIFGCREINDYDMKFRGKLVIDYIAEEIRKKPLSIVFLENINKADMLLQNSLSQAIKTGKFSDSRGREIGINNTIFVSTSNVPKDSRTLSFETMCTKFSEERVVGAQGLEMQILIGNVCEDRSKIIHSNVVVTSKKETPRPSSVNRKRLIESSDIIEQCATSEWSERAQKIPKYLDLNLPMDETEAVNSDYDNSDSDTLSENSELWLEEFLAQMDGTVTFKPFDFDALANRLLKEISVVFRNTIGSECLLEVDSKVMEQILAAAWLSDERRVVEDWVEHILGRSFTEVKQRYALKGRSVLKLVTCDDLYVNEQAAGVCLPSRIIVN